MAGTSLDTYCSYCNGIPSDEAVFETAAVGGSSGICSVSFSHYRYSYHYGRGNYRTGITSYVYNVHQ